MTDTLDIAHPEAPWQPYLMQDHPKSRDHILLSQALEQYTLVEWGISAEDIAAAFIGGRDQPQGALDRERVLVAVRMLTDLILSDRLTTQVRPFGGGQPRALSTCDWEIDDPLRRFAWSAMDPSAPFERDANPTHWVMVSRSQMDEIVARLCQVSVEQSQPDVSTTPENLLVTAARVASGGAATSQGRLLGLPEVMKRTSLSKSTIYGKIEAGSFPKQIPLGARKSVWREEEVADWIADPR